jgi:hypothetical protein
LRFSGLAAWADSLIKADELSWTRKNRTTLEEMRQIRSLFILILLDRFLRKGTEVAIRAVDSFDALGAVGFSVGQTAFEGRNKNVMRGRDISDRLRAQVPQLTQLAQLFEKESGTTLALELRTLVRSRTRG